MQSLVGSQQALSLCLAPCAHVTVHVSCSRCFCHTLAYLHLVSWSQCRSMTILVS